MSMQPIAVLPPDDELVVTTWLRSKLEGTQWASAIVSNRLDDRPAGHEVLPGAGFVVVVRCDGGPALTPPAFTRRFGIRIFGPDGDDSHIKTSELGRHIAAWLHTAPLEASSIAATRHVSGPHRVPPATGRPELYLTCELVLIGEQID